MEELNRWVAVLNGVNLDVIGRRQTAAVRRFIDNGRRRSEEAERRKAEAENAGPVPQGKHTLTGEVVSAQIKDDDWSVERFEYMQEFEQGLLDFNDDLVANAYTSFGHTLGGPVVITSDQPVIAAQRVQYYTSFNEIAASG